MSASTVREIKNLQRVYGKHASLDGILERLLGNRIHDCPACKATGKVMQEVRIPYPSGLPDSGWVPDTIEYKQVDCKLCQGYGYNEKEYKPRMVQDGWE